MKRPIFVVETLMKQFQQAIPFERLELHPEFREVDSDIVLNEHKWHREEIMHLFASMNRSILESELQKEKEEREKEKQEYIASWKEQHKQTGQLPPDP